LEKATKKKKLPLITGEGEKRQNVVTAMRSVVERRWEIRLKEAKLRPD